MKRRSFFAIFLAFIAALFGRKKTAEETFGRHCYRAARAYKPHDPNAKLYFVFRRGAYPPNDYPNT